MREIEEELLQHLAPWRQKLLALVEEANAPDRPLQESDDGDHAEPERTRSEANKPSSGGNKKA
jgi:hypothetical protein